MIIFWFRRDLRLKDNKALYYAFKHAIKTNTVVQPIFIFDKNILKDFAPSRKKNELDVNSARVAYIYENLTLIDDELKRYGGRLWMYHDTVDKVFRSLVQKHEINAVFSNRDYEEGPITRDLNVAKYLAKKDIQFMQCKDHVIYDDILNKQGQSYRKFTPYADTWRSRLKNDLGESIARRDDEDQLIKTNPNILKNYTVSASSMGRATHQSARAPHVTLDDLGYHIDADVYKRIIPKVRLSPNTIINFDGNREYPAAGATTRMSLSLRFGTLSIRDIIRKALRYVDIDNEFINELIWREFYIQLLYHAPWSVTENFNQSPVDRGVIVWRYGKKAQQDFMAWCKGETGVDLVDAGMRQLNTEGHMHGRVRMVVASYLTKQMGIDWRWGEQYFAQKLLDYDQAANVGNWQWCAGTGVDTMPYFRMFNPDRQQKKYDRDCAYTCKYLGR